MKKIFPLIAILSIVFFSCDNSTTLEKPNAWTDNCEVQEISLENDFIEIHENENQPFLNLGFLGGLGSIIGSLIGGGGSSPQPPVYPPPPPPAPAPPQNNSSSDSKDSGLMPMLIILVVAILGFFGLKKL